MFLFFSLHVPGLVILFLHDFGDIWLETAKATIYFKYKDGKRKWLPEFLANCSFAIFALQWCVCVCVCVSKWGVSY